MNASTHSLVTRPLCVESRDLKFAAVIAAALHAIVLLASPAGPPTVVLEPKVDKTDVAPPPVTVVVEPPELVADEALPDVTKQTASEAIGGPPALMDNNPHGIEFPTDVNLLRPDAKPDILKPIGPITSLDPSGPGGPRILDVSSLDRAPEPVSQIPPAFPSALKRELSQGRVRAAFVIERDGSVSRIRILSESHPGFGESAERALARWKFRPGWKNNRPTACRMIQEFTFSMK